MIISHGCLKNTFFSSNDNTLSLNDEFSINGDFDKYYSEDKFIFSFGNLQNIDINNIFVENKFNYRIFNDCTGDYIIGVYDNILKELTIYRNSSSAVPVFYVFYNQNHYFSTSLEKLKLINDELNEKYFLTYLCTGVTETEMTPYLNIHRLLPGYSIKCDGSKISLSKCCDMIASRKKTDRSILSNEFYRLFEKSIQNSMAEHSVIGCEISGGLDSSAIAYQIDKLSTDEQKLIGLSFIFEDESNLDKINEVYNTTAFEPVYIDMTKFWIFKDVPEGVPQIDEPNILTINYSYLKELNEVALKHNIEILYSGEGGDNLFAYSNYYLIDLMSKSYKALKEELTSLSKYYKQPSYKLILAHILSGILPESIRNRLDSKLSTRSWINIDYYSRYFIPSWLNENFAKKITYKELFGTRKKLSNTGLNNFMQQNDLFVFLSKNPCIWINEHFFQKMNVNKFNPYRDYSTMNFMFSLDYIDKAHFGEQKSLLTNSNLIPDSISKNPDKSETLFTYYNGIKNEWDKIEKIVKESRLVSLGFINEDELMHSLQKFKTGYHEEFIPIIRTLSLEVWFIVNGY